MTPVEIKHIKGNILCGFDDLSSLPVEHRDRDLCIRAFETQAFNARYIPEDMFNEEFILLAIKQTNGGIIGNIPPDKITKDVLEAFKPYLCHTYVFVSLRHIIPDELITTEFMKWVYKDSGIFASCSMFAGKHVCDWVNPDNVDEELALLMYNLSVFSLKYIPEQFLTIEMCKETALIWYDQYKRVNTVLNNIPQKFYHEIKTLMDLISCQLQEKKLLLEIWKNLIRGCL